MKIESIRDEYKFAELNETNISENPFTQFDCWLNEVLNSKLSHSTAMAVTSFGTAGFPESRIVLLKSFDENGFVFFTNYDSEKAKSINKNPKTGLHFFWPTVERQVRITGFASKTSTDVSDAYFKSRPRQSNIAAWASKQSTQIPSREYLENQFQKYDLKFKNKEIPRPEFWGGYIVKPVCFEFWQGRENRLHDRILYELQDNNWSIKRLAP
jgi:pyridoxamine 5'-phosphate oxidase